jgi:hypothetical protein
MKVSIYIAQSYSRGEKHCFTCGWTRWGNLRKAMIRKHARLLHNSGWFTVANRAEAIAIETACHRKATRMFGSRANVRFSTTDTGDSRNSRSNEWWFDKTTKRFLPAMTRESNIEINNHKQISFKFNGD